MSHFCSMHFGRIYFLVFCTSRISGLYNIYSVAPKRLVPKQTLCQNRCCVKMACTKTLAPKHNVLMFFYIIDILLWSRVEQLTVSLHFPIWYENDIFRVSVNQRLDPDPAVHPLEELLYRLALHPRKWPDLFSGAHYLNFCLLWSPIFPLASRGDIVVPLTHTVNE